LTVRQSERRSEARKNPGKPAPRDPNIVDLEASVSNALGLKVQITHRVDKSEDKGEIKIAYSSLEQLDDLVRRLKNAR
jgi:ParB family transcriptional regulator, chromosome partitioning protein